MDLQGPDFYDSRDPIVSNCRDPTIIFSDFRDPIVSDCRDPTIIFSDSRDPIFNSKKPG